MAMVIANTLERRGRGYDPGMQKDSLSAAQFEALAKLISLREGPAREGARLVMVEGARAVDAAALLSVSVASVGNTLARVRAAKVLADVAAGGAA